MTSAVRILLLADSHLGFDLPIRPRVKRRRRGHDFLANYAAALAPALAGHVDIVVHGGDVFHRSRVPSTLAYQAFEPLRQVAAQGVPVFIVPGNHERSRLPHQQLAAHPLIHVFDRPRTFHVQVRDARVVLSGFPYQRHDVRTHFSSLLGATEWKHTPADVRLLCLHHCVEGARVGPADFTFTTGSDVIRARDLPNAFAAVLSGHIHRHQVLQHDLVGRSLPAPVCYPGSIERTSTAEIGETKGFLILEVKVKQAEQFVRWEFRPLPARPMLRHDLTATGMTGLALETAVRDLIAQAPPEAVLTIRVDGELHEELWRRISAARLRALAPGTMNVRIVPKGYVTPPLRRARRSGVGQPSLFSDGKR